MRHWSFPKAILLLVAAALPSFGAGGVLAKPRVCPVLYVEEIEGRGGTKPGGVVLGGALARDWLSPERTALHLRGGERYWLYSGNRLVGEVIGGKPVRQDKYHYLVEFSPAKPRISQSSSQRQSDVPAIAIGSPNAVPRKAKTTEPRKADLDAVSDVVKRKGLQGHRMGRVSVYVVDLEGDGSLERVVSATSAGYDPWMWRKGDYSLVLLQAVRSKPSKTLLLSSEFHTVNRQDAYPQEYTVAGFWDVDGDGILEIGVGLSCPRADASGLQLYRVRDGRATRIASGGLGR